MDNVHRLVLITVRTLYGNLSAAILTLHPLLCAIISFASNHLGVVYENQRSVLFLVNQTELFI